MGFVCNGRYVLDAVTEAGANKYVDLQIRCLGETYSDITDAEFAARHRADKANLLEEFAENIAAPGARAWLAYEVPGWTPSGGLSCAVGASLEWENPVGLGLSRPGPLSWESYNAGDACTRRHARAHAALHTGVYPRHGVGAGDV